MWTGLLSSFEHCKKESCFVKFKLWNSLIQTLIERNYSHFYLINVFSAVIRQSIKFYFSAKKDSVFANAPEKKRWKFQSRLFIFCLCSEFEIGSLQHNKCKTFSTKRIRNFFLFILKRFLNSDCAYLYLLTETCFEFIRNRHKISIQFVALNTFSMAWICFYLIICSNVFLSLSFYFSFNIRFQVGRWKSRGCVYILYL